MTKELIILDGGMGHELIRRGSPPGGLWSAKALIDKPESVRAVHQDYIDAGAQVIITNSYSTIPSYLAKENMQSRYIELTKVAAQLAREVADQAKDVVRVAGSVPPLNESYRHDLVPEDAHARPIYQAIVGALSDYVDLYVCETMSSVREAVNAAWSVRKTDPNKPLWVALTSPMSQVVDCAVAKLWPRWLRPWNRLVSTHTCLIAPTPAPFLLPLKNLRRSRISQRVPIRIDSMCLQVGH